MYLDIILSLIMSSVIMLDVALFYCYAECHYAECRYAECLGARTYVLIVRNKNQCLVTVSIDHLTIDSYDRKKLHSCKVSPSIGQFFHL
jgi:hypothetical protein